MREAQFQGENCFGILGLGKAFELFMRRIKLSEFKKSSSSGSVELV